MGDGSHEGVWPPLAYEARPWASSLPGELSATMRRRLAGPYDAAVSPPIANLSVHLPAHVLADSAEATAEVARFDEYATARLGEGEVAPMSAVLLRTESASSSQIENLTVGARQLAIAELTAEVGDTGLKGAVNARLVTANVRAMDVAIELSDTLNEDAILAMHRELLSASLPEQAGKLRDQQVWIGGSAYGPHGAQFIPPHHERIQAALRDLVAFTARDDVPVLPHVALAHAQFETIHPFVDGNGRTGRALVQAMMRRKRLTRRVTVPISAGLLTDTSSYFRALGSYREGDPVPIVEQFTNASLAAVHNGRQLVDDLATMREDWKSRIRARSDSSAWALADALAGQPVINIAWVTHHFQVSVPTAQRSIDTLLEAEVLTPTGRQRRNRTWQSAEVLTALDAFAARTQRRSFN